MKEENLSGEQREKTIEQAMRAIWCERGNRIERNRISEIDHTINVMEIEIIEGILA